MLIVFNCKELAIRRAKDVSKTNNEVKLYETDTRKYMVSDQPLDYREINFRDINLRSLGKIIDEEYA